MTDENKKRALIGAICLLLGGVVSQSFVAKKEPDCPVCPMPMPEPVKPAPPEPIQPTPTPEPFRPKP